MSQWFSQRAKGEAACEGECFECRDKLSRRLLWPVQATVNEETHTVLLCFACAAVAMLRMAAENLEEPTNSGPGTEQHRCERCQRRSRPTREYYGFHLCGECSGAKT